MNEWVTCWQKIMKGKRSKGRSVRRTHYTEYPQTFRQENVPSSERNVKRTENELRHEDTPSGNRKTSFRHGDETSEERTFHQGGVTSSGRSVTKT